MPYIAQQVTIGTTAVKIVSQNKNPQNVILHNHSHPTGEEGSVATEIFIGPSNVTASSGIHLMDSQDMKITVPAGDELYAISDGAGRELHVLIRTF